MLSHDVYKGDANVKAVTENAAAKLESILSLHLQNLSFVWPCYFISFQQESVQPRRNNTLAAARFLLPRALWGSIDRTQGIWKFIVNEQLFRRLLDVPALGGARIMVWTAAGDRRRGAIGDMRSLAIRWRTEMRETRSWLL